MLTVELLKSEESALEAELAGMEPKRKRLSLIKELLATYGSSANQTIMLDAPSVSPSKRFANFKPVDALRAFLKEKPDVFFTPREIVNGMIEGGHVPTSQNFATIIFTTCKRKAESGELEVKDQDGKKAFRIHSLFR